MFSARSLIARFPFRLSPLVVLLMTASLALPVQAQTPVFTPLGDFPGGSVSSYAFGVSSDGSVVTGYSPPADGFEAFRWTAATGLVRLGELPEGLPYSYGFAVSADGTVVVGQGHGANGYEAFRWSQATGIVGLGDLPGGGFSSTAVAVSANGSVVVGKGTPASGGGAYRWTSATGMVSLGGLPGGTTSSDATGVSADGTVVVGRANGPNGNEIYIEQAYRWTAATGMVGLGDLPGGSVESLATAVSSDGAVVVGLSNSGNGDEAFRWTAATGMVGLGALPSDFSYSVANGVSANGAVVVGDSNGVSGTEAFLWTPATGMVSLKQHLLTNYASSLPADFEDWRLIRAKAVSADGTVIVGFGLDPNGIDQAWRVRLTPVPPASAWTPVDIAVNRTDNTSRVLWRQNNGRYAVWKLSATGVVQVGKYYGPITGYTCNQIAVGPDGRTTLLWKNGATKQAALWTLAPDLSSIVKATVYAYPSGYTPRNIAVDPQNNIRMTLRRANRQLVFWTIAPSTGAVTGASGVYAPSGNLQDGPIAIGPDGRIRLVWKDIYTGAAVVWTIPSAYGAPSAGYNYNPVAGATASDIAVGADNKTRLQWLYTAGADTGKIALWKLNTTVGGNGAIESGKFYGPLGGVLPRGLSVGGDNQTRQLWTYSTGKAALWVLNDPLASISAAYTYGPIP